MRTPMQIDASPPAPQMTAAPVESTAISAPAADSPPTAPAYGGQTRVPYPIDALRRHEHGTVLLRVLVSASGTAQVVEIARSSGSPRLDRAAQAAVKRWIFKPATSAGVARAEWARVPVTFGLSAL